MMSKALVAYFSASGVTKKAAQALVETIGGDLYEIIPEVLYSEADLDWRNENSRSSLEMKDKSSRPAIVKTDANVKDYDVIFVGFPIWWYIAPTIINTFLESYDFSGKTIILFATAGSSGFGKTVDNLKGSVCDTAVIKEGIRITSKQSPADIAKWAKGLKL